MTPKAVVMLKESLLTSKCHMHNFIMFTSCAQGWNFLTEIDRSSLQKYTQKACPSDRQALEV